ncbi:30S ribosomal protein S18 [Mycoplasma haemocanis str. Illinois]|uniref:Small ribosomal subunit protein bS18 n=1 Tax=Mycoplasma haemocanis (strain Illinois) TaxID=1111676 RepID=H6N5W8_MYCHN|nr:30S ribosomal protein S18 [Mycoplasma haemocanis]AEW44883.1 30S ribosomal protein S18 [Mycoplasma haemocanis str. Illinois]
MENQQSQNTTVQETTTSVRKKRRKHKKVCWLCKWGCLHIDYKNVDFLKRYLKNNKIITHKITGNCLRHQHQIAFAIKRARVVALLPFVGD